MNSLCAWKRKFAHPTGGDNKDAEIRRLKRKLGPGNRHHLYQDAGRLRLSDRRDRSLFLPRRRLVDAKSVNKGRCPAGVANGRMTTQAEEQSADPLRLGLTVYQHGLGVVPESPQSGTFHEPTWEPPR